VPIDGLEKTREDELGDEDREKLPVGADRVTLGEGVDRDMLRDGAEREKLREGAERETLWLLREGEDREMDRPDDRDIREDPPPELPRLCAKTSAVKNESVISAQTATTQIHLNWFMICPFRFPIRIGDGVTRGYWMTSRRGLHSSL
jgi:hypothetical protein